MFEFIKNPHEIISYIVLSLFICFIILEAVGYYKINYEKSDKPVDSFWLKIQIMNQYIYKFIIYFIIGVYSLSLITQIFLTINELNKPSTPAPVSVKVL